MKMLENLPIPGFIADPDWGNRWNVGTNQAVSAYLDEAGNLTFTKSNKFTLHTVLNGTVSDLDSLGKGRGVLVRRGESYTVALNVDSKDKVRSQLVVHEFNANGVRLTRTVIENLERVLYVPSHGTASLAISLRTTGQGRITVRGLEFNPANAGKTSPGIHKHGRVLEPGQSLQAPPRDEYTILLPLRKALYDGTPLSVLFERHEALEATNLLIAKGRMLEAKALVEGLGLYSDLTTSRLRKLYWHGRRTGYVLHALAAMDEIISRTGNTKDIQARAVLNSEYEFHRDPWGLLRELPNDNVFSPEGPVVHVVGKALPERQTGYTVRTKYTVDALQNAGLECVVAVQAGGNYDEGLDEVLEHDVSGIRTVLLAGPPKNQVLRDEWMQCNAQGLYDLVRRLRPSVLHAHSDFTNGVLATHVGEATGVPVVYESRGFWEETWLSRIAKVQNWEDTELILKLFGTPDLYSLRRESERRVRERADRVVTLAETMKDFILKESPNGEIDPNHVLLARNAVDPEDFPVPTKPSPVREKLDIDEDTIVVGYISSIVEYEGIETLIDGYNLMRQATPNACLLIVGDGPHLNRLRKYTEKNRIPNCIFTGRVPHNEVLDYYHAIDIFVVPRRRSRVTELVTPLKPFEAFSTGRTVVVSNVDALAEIAMDSGGIAYIFRADEPNSLAAVLADLTSNASLREQLGNAGADWVRRDRSWSANVPTYLKVYDELGVST